MNVRSMIRGQYVTADWVFFMPVWHPSLQVPQEHDLHASKSAMVVIGRMWYWWTRIRANTILTAHPQRLHQKNHPGGSAPRSPSIGMLCYDMQAACLAPVIPGDSKSHLRHGRHISVK
jgi:hypothetical protein